MQPITQNNPKSNTTQAHRSSLGYLLFLPLFAALTNLHAQMDATIPPGPAYPAGVTPTNAQSPESTPPPTPAETVIDELHGYKLVDPYQWLEDKTAPRVRQWTEAQHNFTRAFIENKTTAVKGLRAELEALLDRDEVTPPTLRGDREFFLRKLRGKRQHALYTRLAGKEVLLLDPEALDTSGKTAIQSIAYTKKGDKAAIGLQTKGAEIQTVYIIDTKTAKQLYTPIQNLRGFSWTYDELACYITVQSLEMINKQEPGKVYRHVLGTPHSQDKFLIAPKDAKDFASYTDAEHAALTFESTGDFYSNTLKMRPAGSDAAPTQIYSSTKYRAYPEAIGNKIYFYTNHEAPNFKLMVADVANPTFENWRTLIPEQQTMMKAYVITTDYIIVQDRKEARSRLLAYSLDGKLIKEIPLPEPAEVVGIKSHKESNAVFVSLSTFTSPAKLYRLDGKTLEWKLFWQEPAPIPLEDIETQFVFYTSKDGTKVPLYIVHKKGLQLDGNNPALLYGYGGFNIGMTPSYLGAAAAFLKRGGIYALALIRGGDEFGESWHEAGMKSKKQNVFDDFIAAGEYLIAQKYTSPKKLAIKGGSNGGLLMGAMATQRPDLFAAVVCGVPLLDMIRYHKFLIARYWIPEYGDPEQEADFRTLLQYSPYHNIRLGVNLPPMFVIAGENDTRVDPLHAKKFVARAQSNNGQLNPVLLYMHFDSGHGSGQSVRQKVDNMEMEWRFIFHHTGLQ